MILACPVCGSDDFYRIYEELMDYEYQVPYSPSLEQCCSCGLVRQEKQVIYDELKLFYPDDYLVYNTSLRSASSALFSRLKGILYERRARQVAKTVGGSGNVLDVGCAGGGFLRMMQRKGDYRLYGLDIKNNGVDFRKHSIEFREGCLEESDYPENFFDVIVMDNLIEHVPDPGVFIKKVRFILKPGGYVFGATPNFNSIDRRVFGKYWGGFHMPRHIYLFNSRNLTMLLGNYGFVDIQLSATANAGNWAVSLQNLIRRNQRKRGKYRRASYFALIGLACAPLALLSSLFNLNGVIDFECRKRM